METKRRCFIALDLSKAVINEIRGIQKKIEKENIKKNLFMGKFTKPENLHLTLKFLGEINEEKISKVKEKLDEIKFKSFDSEISKIGVFSKKFIKIIWIKLENVGKLQKNIDDKLKNFFDSEYRFMGHITIVRVKNVFNKQELINCLNKIKIEKIKFTINSFVLKESELNSEGPVCKDIEKYNLES